MARFRKIAAKKTAKLSERPKGPNERERSMESIQREAKRNVTREKTKRVEVLLPPSVYEKLKERAKRDGLAMTVELKMAIRKHLGSEDW